MPLLIYDVDSAGAVEWSKPGAATACMTVEKVKNGEERRRGEEKEKRPGEGEKRRQDGREKTELPYTPPTPPNRARGGQ